MNDQIPPDFALMQRVILRDALALTALYERYHNLIYSLALRVIQDSGLAEEVTQDTFIDLWQRPESWDASKGQLSSWLLTVTRYKAIDRLRKENRQTARQTYLPDDSVIPGKSAVSSSDPRWENGQIFHSLLAKLPTEQAQLIELAFFQGLTHSQLASMLDLPLGTVKTRLRLGLHKLRELWEEIADSQK